MVEVTTDIEPAGRCGGSSFAAAPLGGSWVSGTPAAGACGTAGSVWRTMGLSSFF